ncbi:MAG TPA: hypothetical protein VHG08_20045 [Longimicrobium sp.]|nr:hypothetical protein [Longimicrobium sp.]
MAPKDGESLRALMAELAREGETASQSEQRLIPQLRAAVAERVERTSLRSAAREIGMSPTGLKKFLDGNMPYTKTIHRLRAWYVHHAADRQEETSGEAAFSAFGVLVHDLPPGTQSQTVEAMLHCIEQGYLTTRRPVPAWVRQLRQHYGVPPRD